MTESFEFENFRIEKEFLEREINYLVYEGNSYICRLAPGYAGFELSKLDVALGVQPPEGLVNRLSDYIVQRDA